MMYMLLIWIGREWNWRLVVAVATPAVCDVVRRGAVLQSGERCVCTTYSLHRKLSSWFGFGSQDLLPSIVGAVQQDQVSAERSRTRFSLALSPSLSRSLVRSSYFSSLGLFALFPLMLCIQLMPSPTSMSFWFDINMMYVWMCVTHT